MALYAYADSKLHYHGDFKKKAFFCSGHLENTAAAEGKENNIFFLKIQNNIAHQLFFTRRNAEFNYWG